MKVIEDIFPAAMVYTSVHEGIYANDPYDSGGETIYGIAKKFHRHKFTEVYELYKGARYHDAKKVAEQFYRAQYWNELYNYMHLKTLAIKVFDLGVNIGKAQIR
jgi:lysozyme family protein